MVYLFDCVNNYEIIEMRVTAVGEEEVVAFTLNNIEDNTEMQICLSKKDVYELIGALHHIHKNL
jgi:hypothetical protein